jgi:N-acetyl-anhydromuramyl-L-alanine amidase AmpD
LHHTGWGNYKSNIKYLTTSTAQASVHFIIWENGEICKCFENEPKVMWHAWVSTWGSLTNMNKYSLWIEVVGYGEYNIHQLISLTDLTEYLMGNFNIPKENVLRHCDLTNSGSASKKLWDWKSKSRKVDIWLDFFWWTTDDFVRRRSQLTPRQTSRFWNI